MKVVSIGIIGVGMMGTSYAKYLSGALIQGAKLTAVLDQNVEKAKWIKENINETIHVFSDNDRFFKSRLFDAVLIATPHYQHTEMAIRAFENGLNVLCEKPAGVYTKQVREMNEAANNSGLVFSMMYNQRTNPLYKKLRDLIITGELGEIRRMNWLITDWYRSQSYYDSANWRATWAGEGGGVLINQSPHQLDLWHWLTGMMPTRIRAFCYFGKHRNIEVEDDVTAFAEYENGATGVFITSTGEAPGTNRLEIAGDRGKIVIEEGSLTFWRLRIPESQFNKENKHAFGSPECWKCEIPITGKESGHIGIIQNFVDAILTGDDLIAPGQEGINGLMLSNAMQLSTWLDSWIELPIDEELYFQHLQKKIDSSTVN